MSKKEIQRVYPEDKNLLERIKKYNDIIVKSKKLKNSESIIKESLKKVGEKEYIKLYKELEKNPETIAICARSEDEDTHGEYLYVPSDKYGNIKSKDDAIRLRVELGNDDLVEEVIEHKIDQKMFTKYESVIKELIDNCDDIEESDKDSFFYDEYKYNIKKGTINEMNDLDEPLEKVFERISPVVSVKSPKVTEIL